MGSMLIVEDDARVRETLYDLFADWHICHVAETAEQALGYLADEDYDVVLTDLSMPGLSGLELLGRVRQRYPNVVVIIISGIDDKEHARGLIELGAFDYLVKPFRIEEVEASVERAMEQRRSADQLAPETHFSGDAQS
ncbi:MAG TPA: response regulator [Pyrinomonadaceae bacterium]|jgi:DNA-binding NtrC family response regulator|nr:response regulator [Pyrinomonadaceae bacterium]